ncbi:MAG TPA: type II toxin-antitoxin system prevent-host-death family antitoxin [Vicinamibacterales bacterium]
MPRYKIRHPEKSVGVRELRQNLSVYLERVKKGESLTVTDRGQEVAILRPMPKTDGLIERLIAEGRATPPTRTLRDVLRDIKARRLEWKGEKPITEVLDELREDII